jgi:hypothetical protein
MAGSTYIYKNECSTEITIRVVVRKEKLYVAIPVGESYHDNFSYMSDTPPPPPPSWVGSLLSDSIIVSNGTHYVVHRHINNDPLYQEELYTITENKKYKRTYLWTFRDEDFVGAEPIVP